ncbi:MAG: hypothetical protein QX190_00410 [Methylococcales bacterium]
MSIIELAQLILKDKKEMHFKDIAQQAMILDNSLGADLEVVAKKVSQALSNHIKTHDKKPTSLFRRVKSDSGGFKAGLYALIKKKPQPIVIVNPPPIGTTNMPTGFLGKAGEYGVFSELLYWGYNPAMMVVDYGVDIIASKNGEYFHIQVKTANPNGSNGFSFKIRQNIFQAHDNSKTFYVFVIRRVVNNRQLSDYVILPSNTIRYLIDSKTITSAKDISFSITIEDNEFKVNNKYVLTGVNDFSKIR